MTLSITYLLMIITLCIFIAFIITNKIHQRVELHEDPLAKNQGEKVRITKLFPLAASQDPSKRSHILTGVECYIPLFSLGLE